eukprot:m.197754 g.197754  ORF g.197754 m.197754 type:complete len:376 (-) comp17669_c0_seq2:3019-4146(-)
MGHVLTSYRRNACSSSTHKRHQALQIHYSRMRRRHYHRRFKIRLCLQIAIRALRRCEEFRKVILALVICKGIKRRPDVLLHVLNTDTSCAHGLHGDAEQARRQAVIAHQRVGLLQRDQHGGAVLAALAADDPHRQHRSRQLLAQRQQLNALLPPHVDRSLQEGQQLHQTGVEKVDVGLAVLRPHGVIRVAVGRTFHQVVAKLLQMRHQHSQVARVDFKLHVALVGAVRLGLHLVDTLREHHAGHADGLFLLQGRRQAQIQVLAQMDNQDGGKAVALHADRRRRFPLVVLQHDCQVLQTLHSLAKVHQHASLVAACGQEALKVDEEADVAERVQPLAVGHAAWVALRKLARQRRQEYRRNHAERLRRGVVGSGRGD